MRNICCLPAAVRLKSALWGGHARPLPEDSSPTPLISRSSSNGCWPLLTVTIHDSTTVPTLPILGLTLVYYRQIHIFWLFFFPPLAETLLSHVLLPSWISWPLFLSTVLPAQKFKKNVCWRQRNEIIGTPKACTCLLALIYQVLRERGNYKLSSAMEVLKGFRERGRSWCGNDPGGPDALLTLQKGKPWNNEGVHGVEFLAGEMWPRVERSEWAGGGTVEGAPKLPMRSIGGEFGWSTHPLPSQLWCQLAHLLSLKHWWLKQSVLFRPKWVSLFLETLLSWS